MAELRGVWNRPSLFLLPPSHSEQYPYLFGLGDLVEDPEGSGLYPFAEIGATIPVLTAHPGNGKAPYVDVFIDIVPDGVDRLTVWRQQDQRWMPVRGAVGVRNVGAWSGHDFEAGFDRTLTYRVQYYQEDGTAVGFSDVATIELPGPDRDYVWVHDPLDPSQALKLTMVETFGQSIARASEAAIVRPLGRSTSVALPGTRSGVASVALDVFTETRAEGEAFDRMIGGYDDPALSILCFRTRRETWLPGTLFAFVSAEFKPWDMDGESVVWVVSGTEVQPPVPAVITPDITYAAFEAAYSSYGEFESTYGSYIEAQRDDSIVGG